MKKKTKDKRNIVLNYKDAYLNDLIKPEDFIKFLENPEIKEELDLCLNEFRHTNNI